MILLAALPPARAGGGLGSRQAQHLAPGPGHHAGGRRLFLGHRLVAAPAGRLAVPHLRFRRHRVHPQPAAAMAGHAGGRAHHALLPAGGAVLPRCCASRRTPWECPRPSGSPLMSGGRPGWKAWATWWRPGLAGTLATLVGAVAGFGHNYWAMVAAVVPLVGHTTRHRVGRGVQRIIGTVLGLHCSPASCCAARAVADGPGDRHLPVRRRAVHRPQLRAGAGLRDAAGPDLHAAGGARPRPDILLRDRIMETVIGAAVGIAVVLAPAVWRRLRGQPLQA